jgi:ribosome maturation factor RimP
MKKCTKFAAEIIEQTGNTTVFPCFLSMADVLDQIRVFLEPLLEGTDMFIVNIKIKPTNNIKVFLDADGGLSIDKSVKVNHKLYGLIEENGLFPDGDFSLEVGSPGVDEPLLSVRQYKKNIGRTVAVVLREEGQEKTGVLKEVRDEEIVLETKIPKKKETKLEVIPFTDITKIVVQIVF